RPKKGVNLTRPAVSIECAAALAANGAGKGRHSCVERRQAVVGIINRPVVCSSVVLDADTARITRWFHGQVSRPNTWPFFMDCGDGLTGRPTVFEFMTSACVYALKIAARALICKHFWRNERSWSRP